jgi:ketosteroid isomerase-like protein
MSISSETKSQSLDVARIHEIFRHLESGDGKGFFEHVTDNVDWTVEGTHPLAGHYHRKADFLAHTFENWQGCCQGVRNCTFRMCC